MVENKNQINDDEPIVQPDEATYSFHGVHGKIHQVMKAIGGWIKTDEQVKYDSRSGGAGANYWYLSEEKITTELHKALVDAKLICIPARTKVEPIFEEKNYIDNKGNPVTERKSTKSIVKVTYKIIDIEDGTYEFVEVVGKGADTQDKDTNKAMTGAFKYMQRQTFFISSGDDPDKVASKELDDAEKKGHDEGPTTTATEGKADKELDEIIETLVIKSKSPEISRKLVDAFAGPKQELIKLLEARQ